MNMAVTLLMHISLLRGETLNYRSGIVAKGFLWMVFCHMLFFSASFTKYLRMTI